MAVHPLDAADHAVVAVEERHRRRGLDPDDAAGAEPQAGVAVHERVVDGVGREPLRPGQHLQAMPVAIDDRSPRLRRRERDVAVGHHQATIETRADHAVRFGGERRERRTVVEVEPQRPGADEEPTLVVRENDRIRLVAERGGAG